MMDQCKSVMNSYVIAVLHSFEKAQLEASYHDTDNKHQKIRSQNFRSLRLLAMVLCFYLLVVFALITIGISAQSLTFVQSKLKGDKLFQYSDTCKDPNILRDARADSWHIVLSQWDTLDLTLFTAESLLDAKPGADLVIHIVPGFPQDRRSGLEQFVQRLAAAKFKIRIQPVVWSDLYDRLVCLDFADLSEKEFQRLIKITASGFRDDSRDLAALALLYTGGGYLVQPGYIFLKPPDVFLDNLSGDSNSSPNGALLVFSRGHLFLKDCIQIYRNLYVPYVWTWNLQQILVTVHWLGWKFSQDQLNQITVLDDISGNIKGCAYEMHSKNDISNLHSDREFFSMIQLVRPRSFKSPCWFLMQNHNLEYKLEAGSEAMRQWEQLHGKGSNLFLDDLFHELV